MLRPALNHVGILTRDVDALAAFYREVVGMLETDRGQSTTGRPVIFLSSDPSHHHQLVLAGGRGPDQASTIGQLSFLVPDLPDLREVLTRLRSAGCEPSRVVDHGASWSLYVADPEENTLEFYVISPWYIPQPFAEPLDFSLSDAEIRRLNHERCRSIEGFQSMDDWSASMTGRLGHTS